MWATLNDSTSFGNKFTVAQEPAKIVDLHAFWSIVHILENNKYYDIIVCSNEDVIYFYIKKTSHLNLKKTLIKIILIVAYFDLFTFCVIS